MPKTQRRRRIEAKTNYKTRFSLLKSELPRLVIRKTNRYVIAQIVRSDISKDKVIISVNSKDLLEEGWPKNKSGSLKSLQAAYLTGFMLGKKSKSDKEAILDKGLNRNVHGSRVYAALAGAIDSGMKVPHAKEALPTKDRMSFNKELFSLMEKIKEKIK